MKVAPTAQNQIKHKLFSIDTTSMMNYIKQWFGNHYLISPCDLFFSWLLMAMMRQLQCEVLYLGSEVNSYVNNKKMN